MIAQPTSPTTTSPLALLEQDVLVLRATLNDALGRIRDMEQQVAAFSPAAIREEHQLVRRDSDEMQLALRLCEELFPANTTEVDVECDPSDPHWKWYTVTVHWVGGIRESIDRQMEWHERLAQAYPGLSDQFRMIVDVQ